MATQQHNIYEFTSKLDARFVIVRRTLEMLKVFWCFSFTTTHSPWTFTLVRLFYSHTYSICTYIPIFEISKNNKKCAHKAQNRLQATARTRLKSMLLSACCMQHSMSFCRCMQLCVYAKCGIMSKAFIVEMERQCAQLKWHMSNVGF